MLKAMLYKVKIPFRWVAVTAYAIMIIPSLIFFFGWLKWYFAVIFSGILLLGAFWLIKKDYLNNKDYIEIPIDVLLISSGVFLFWIFISGNCYTSVGYCDIQWRNATLSDLVNYNWPVYYPESDRYLCYYFTFWLVPALFGKLFGGVAAAFIAQACWLFLILMTIFLLISNYFKDFRKPTLIVIILFMVMWSGITALGNLLNHYTPAVKEAYCYGFFDVDPETDFIFYRSNMNFFGQIYNQLPVWLAVPLFLQNRTIHSYAFLGLVLFPFSPWGTVGIALIMLADAVRYIVKNKSFRDFLMEVFSPANVCGICSCFVVTLFFLACSDSQFGNASQLVGLMLPSKDDFFYAIHDILVFWVCEFGLYYLFTWKKYKKDFLYVSMLPILIITPFVWVMSPDSRDYCMDGAAPQLYMLMLYVIGYIKDEVLYNNFNFRDKFNSAKAVLIALVLFAANFSISEIFDKASDMVINGKISIQETQITSFSDMLGYEGPFGSNKSGDVSEAFFFKYLAKTSDESTHRWVPISNEFSEIRSIDKFDEYLDYLKGKDCVIFIVSEFDDGYRLDEANIQKIKQLGFGNEINKLNGKETGSFMGIVECGSVILESVSEDDHNMFYSSEEERPGNITMACAEWVDRSSIVTIDSRAKYSDASMIKIDSRSYSSHGRGLNIVVYDNAAGRVIDSVAFDVSAADPPCVRKSMQ